MTHFTPFYEDLFVRFPPPFLYINLIQFKSISYIVLLVLWIRIEKAEYSQKKHTIKMYILPIHPIDIDILGCSFHIIYTVFRPFNSTIIHCRLRAMQKPNCIL